jgi:hypothetical protein
VARGGHVDGGKQHAGPLARRHRGVDARVHARQQLPELHRREARVSSWTVQHAGTEAQRCAKKCF